MYINRTWATFFVATIWILHFGIGLLVVYNRGIWFISPCIKMHYKKIFLFLLVKAENISRTKRLNDDHFEDPRSVHLRNVTGYEDRVRNMIINYCSWKSDNLAYRYLIPKADIQVFFWLCSALKEKACNIRIKEALGTLNNRGKCLFLKSLNL